VASDLTKEEQANVLAALRFMLVRCGNREVLAKALRYEVGTVRHTLAGRISISPTMAFRLARMAQVPFDDVTSGKYPVAGTCPHCGRGGIG
jgi:hypothetical protein